MEIDTYHVFLSGSHISWKRPQKLGYATCAAVLIHEKDRERVCDDLHAVARRFKGRLRPFLYKQRAEKTRPVIVELSRLLSCCQNIPFSVPTDDDEAQDSAWDHILPEVLEKVELHLEQLGARGVLYSNYPSLLGYFPTSRLPRFSSVGPNRQELMLAEFADWAQGQHLWQDAILAHYHDQVRRFEEWIRAFPLLGGLHELAGSLVDQINRAPSYVINKECWLRGRVLKQDEVVEASRMGPPPPDLTSEGRYNHAGKPVLYLSTDEATCEAEISDAPIAGPIWIQEFEIKAKRVLDLSFYPDLEKGLAHDESELLVAALHGAIKQPSDHNSNWKPEYYVTRYIADIVRWKGYDGIRFNSTKGAGLNLALFNWESDVLTIAEPRISRLGNLVETGIDST